MHDLYGGFGLGEVTELSVGDLKLPDIIADDELLADIGAIL